LPRALFFSSKGGGEEVPRQAQACVRLSWSRGNSTDRQCLPSRALRSYLSAALMFREATAGPQMSPMAASLSNGDMNGARGIFLQTEMTGP